MTSLLTHQANVVLPKRLYHGTSLELGNYELQIYLEKTLNETYWGYGRDFGKAFYMTHLIEQTKPWAIKASSKKARKEQSNVSKYIPCVLNYSFDIDLVNSSDILVFTDASRSWAEYILKNRLQNKSTVENYKVYDIVVGYMADNNTGDLVSKYKFDSNYTFEHFYSDIQRTIKGKDLTMDKLGNQYAFCNEALNNSLSLEGCYLREKGVWNYYGINDSHLSRIGLL